METTESNEPIFLPITYEQAKKKVSEMNLIDGFLFDSALEDEEDAKLVMKTILETTFNREFADIKVTPQKNFQAVDTQFHGIRLDARIDEVSNEKATATIFDCEMENRPADKKCLPKRMRYYGSLDDNRLLKSGTSYDSLPDYVTIVISSYDPFDAGDIYYQAETILKTHPTIKYNDGLLHIFLYCNGKINDGMDPIYGKKLQEMLKYILSGEKSSSPSIGITNLESIVSKIKTRSEVTKRYMRQWDRERIREQEIREAVTKEVTESVTKSVTESVTASVTASTRNNDALELINFGRNHEIPDQDIRERLESGLKLDTDTINSLFAQANNELISTEK